MTHIEIYQDKADGEVVLLAKGEEFKFQLEFTPERAKTIGEGLINIAEKVE